MTTNIDFKIKGDTIIISEIKKDINYKSLNQTNIFNLADLKFSTEYVEKNIELVASFLNVIILKNEVTTIVIENNSYALLVMDLVNHWDHINKIIFAHDEKINISIFLELLDNKYVTEIECYEMDNYLIDRLYVNKKIIVKTRHKIEFQSEFMKDNMLNNYSEIYYKRMIVINHELDDNELKDFETFIGINNKLRLIKILRFSKSTLDNLLKVLDNFECHNITIQINEKNNNIDDIYKSVTSLKKKYKQLFENNNIKFKMNYSTEYKSENFLKQVNLKTLSYIFNIVILIALIVGGSVTLNQFKDTQKINDQMDNINSIIEDLYTNSDDFLELETEEVETTTNPANPTEPTTKKKKTTSSYYTRYTQVFDKLLAINPDTVGWLKVPGTRIQYPVVQRVDDPDYYLKRDFTQKKNVMGWIYADSRNDLNNLNDNTIIYGHNIKVGIMFGTLKNILEEDWYTKEKNLTITFNTTKKNMKWKVFSIYMVPKTSHYLATTFTSKEEKLEFIKQIKAKSIHDFDVKVNANSKILTLSTCYQHVNRTVLHAVLIEDNPIEDPEEDEEEVQPITEDELTEEEKQELEAEQQEFEQNEQASTETPVETPEQ